MDFIKKTICIEGARTRTQGLMPYYEFGKAYNASVSGCSDIETLGLEIASGGNGNWGQIVANPCFLSDDGKTYESMLRKYYSLLNAVRNGVKLRKVDTKEGDIIFTEDVGSFEWNGQCFDDGKEPDYLYEYAAYDERLFHSTEITSLRKETRKVYRYSEKEQPEETYIVLVKDYDKFLELSKYLSGTDYKNALSELGPEDIYTGNEHYEWARYCKVVDLCIGKIDIPASIYNEHVKVPKSMPCSDIEEYIAWLENYQNLSADCCNRRLWNDMGGLDMLDFLKTNSGACENTRDVLDNLEYSVPYVEMPLLLIQNYTDVGVFTNVDGDFYDDNLYGPSSDDTSAETRPHGILQLSNEGSGFTVQDEIDLIIHSGAGISIDQILMCSGDTRRTYPTTEQFNANPSAYTDGSGFTNYPIEVESLLQTLRSRKKYTDDKDNVLPGLFQKYDNPAGEMFVCLKGDPKYYQLAVSAYTVDESGTVVDYCVKYVEDDSLSAKDIKGEQNLRTDYDPVFVGGITEAEANNILDEQETLYYSGDTANEYRISLVSAAWIMSAITSEPSDCLNGDGEDNAAVKYTKADTDYTTAEGKYFRTITTPYAGIRIAMTEEEETGELEPAYTHYFFKVKYNNSPETPMNVPYVVGNTTNVYVSNFDSGGCDGLEVYRGDFILSARTIEVSGLPYFETIYVIGGYYCGDENGGFVSYFDGTGDVYYEKHPFDEGHVDYVALDGVDNVPIWSKYVDFDADSKEFYSTRYNLYRTGNTANIIEATTGEQWIKRDGDDVPYSFDAYLTKEEYLINFSLPPKVDVDVTVDRGGVSAFDKHYKLSECNTMQDLTQYNNGEFFPD